MVLAYVLCLLYMWSILIAIVVISSCRICFVFKLQNQGGRENLMHNFYEPKKCAHDTVYTNPISYGQGQAPTIKALKSVGL